MLVSLAAFFFAYLGQVALRSRLAEADDAYSVLNTEHARVLLDQSALQDAATITFGAKMTAESESANLESQLVEAGLQATRLHTQAQAIQETRAAVEKTKEAYESAGPLVTIVEPQPSAAIRVGDEVTLVIVASDLVGIKQVSITIGEDEFYTIPVSPEQTMPLLYPWTPKQARAERITVQAVNHSDVTGRPVDVLIDVQGLPATSTPTATPTPTPTATPTPTPSS